jgi:ketosteroid isomerase-like protein
VPCVTTRGITVEHASDELRTTLEQYLAFRRDVDEGRRSWPELVQFFTDDAVFIDPAWGRVEGREAIEEFLVDSMTGIEDWTFPVDHVYVDGDEVVVKYRQVLPGGRQQSAYTTLLYAGDGKFRYEEDVLNMAQVMEDLGAIGWKPPAGMKLPPRDPDRDFSRP